MPGHRSDDRTKREDALAQAEFFFGKRIAQRRLCGCNQAAAERALHDAPEDQFLDGSGEAAHDRRDREAENRGRIILPPPEAHLQPRRERDDDDGRDDIAGNDPRALIERRAEVALYHRQCHVDDRRVERLHQCGREDARRNDHERETGFDCRMGIAGIRSCHTAPPPCAYCGGWFYSPQRPKSLRALAFVNSLQANSELVLSLSKGVRVFAVVRRGVLPGTRAANA
jgi:hypothetical protein